MPETSILTPNRGHVVVLPSLTLRPDYLALMPGIAAFEERLLFFVLSLRAPSVHITYLSSAPLDQALVNYYLSFLPDPEQARRRLHLLSPAGISEQPLTLKLLKDEPLLDRLTKLIDDGPSECHIIPFNVTSEEEALAARLSVSLCGPSANATLLGGKTAGRRLAKSLGVPVVQGIEDLRSIDMIEAALRQLGMRSRGSTDYVLKLNDSHAGLGNVLLRTSVGARSSLASAEASFPMPGQNWGTILPKVEQRGAVLEALLPMEGLMSPSVAVEISLDGEVTILATHDQYLAGANGQSYAGCSYPADTAYRVELERYAGSIGHALARRGVRGVIGIDFLVTMRSGEPEVHFCELNLRLGGTTHPLGIAQHLVAPGQGTQPRCCYTATDRLTSPSLYNCAPQQIVDRLAGSDLAYSRTTKQGAVLHMVGSARSAGKVGVTCIGADASGAQEIMANVGQLFR